MSQQFLHRADVIASLKEMRREAVSQRVRTNGLHDTGTAARRADGALWYRLVLVMPAALAAARVSRNRRGRKHPLPARPTLAAPIRSCLTLAPSEPARVVKGESENLWRRLIATWRPPYERGEDIAKMKVSQHDAL